MPSFRIFSGSVTLSGHRSGGRGLFRGDGTVLAGMGRVMKEPKEAPNEHVLRSAESIMSYPIQCIDGELGTAKDLLFDDENWRIRYLVARPGGWFSSRKVLVSPTHLVEPVGPADGGLLPVILTKEQLKESPMLESDAPVSRLYEAEFARFHQMAPYWGATPMPRNRVDVSVHELKQKEIEKCHVRSCDEIMGYKISATDGEIGKVSDVIVDVTTWMVRFFVVDTGKWLPGRKVLIDTEWIFNFSVEDQTVDVSLAKDQVKDSPEFDPESPVNRS